MKIAIRVDASQIIGSGHVMRSLVLAQQLQRQHHQVKIISRAFDGNLIATCQAQGIETLALAPSAEKVDHDSQTGEYSAWLGASQLDDAEQSLALLGDWKPDWMIVDHYGIAQTWQQRISAAGIKVMVIDDLANRPHCCDLLLDHNPWPDSAARYAPYIQPATLCLFGAHYALLAPTYAKLRAQLPPKRNQVLAFFSGADPTCEALKLLQACQHITALPFELMIVYGVQNPRRDELERMARPHGVTLVARLENYPYQLAQSRYALGAAGVSALERECLNIPTTLVSVAENQRPMAEFLSLRPNQRYLGTGEHTTYHDYVRELTWLSQHWPPAATSAAHLVDGLGCARVVATLTALAAKA